MTKIFYGFIVEGNGSPMEWMFRDFILKHSLKEYYHYKGEWHHPGCYWMVLE